MSKNKQKNNVHSAENLLEGVWRSTVTEEILSQDFCHNLFTFQVHRTTEIANGDKCTDLFEVVVGKNNDGDFIKQSICIDRNEVRTVIAMLQKIISL